MKKLVGILGVVALVAVLGALAANAAFAQTTTPQTAAPQTTAPQAQATPTTPGAQQGTKQRGGDFGFLFPGGSTAAFDAEAKALNLTPTQLFEQLHSGKTLSDIAAAQGVDLATVQSAAQAVQAQSMKDQIAQAVKDGTMTQAQADWLLQGLDKGYIDAGRGFGLFGGGRGPGGHGMGGLGLPGNQTAPAAPSNGTQG